LPYVFETVRLFDLWHGLTGEDVGRTKDKGSDGEEDEGYQPLTEFVRLVLKMVDPEITLANAKTCIRNAKALRKIIPMSDKPAEEYRKTLILGPESASLNHETQPTLEVSGGRPIGGSDNGRK
jgi:hypothetical protein